MGQLGNKCDLAREQISLRLDGELSEFEQAALDAHLTECARCRAFGASVAGATTQLRSAPLEQPEYPVVLPRRSRIRVPLRAAQVAAAAIVVAAIGITAGGLAPGGERFQSISTPSSFGQRPVGLSPERVARGTSDAHIVDVNPALRGPVRVV